MARHAIGSDKVTVQRLHLDHLGAVVTQNLRGIGAKNHGGEVQDTKSVQRSVGGLV